MKVKGTDFMSLKIILAVLLFASGCASGVGPGVPDPCAPADGTPPPMECTDATAAAISDTPLVSSSAQTLQENQEEAKASMPGLASDAKSGDEDVKQTAATAATRSTAAKLPDGGASEKTGPKPLDIAPPKMTVLTTDGGGSARNPSSDSKGSGLSLDTENSVAGKTGPDALTNGDTKFDSVGGGGGGGKQGSPFGGMFEGSGGGGDTTGGAAGVAFGVQAGANSGEDLDAYLARTGKMSLFEIVNRAYDRRSDNFVDRR